MHFVSEILAQKGRAIFAVHPRSSVLDAIREMDLRSVGALLVVEEGELLGIVSERDYARRVILKGRRSDSTLVEEIMTTKLLTTTAHETLDGCMELMTEKRIRHLPVLDEGETIGVLSIGDLVKAIMVRQRSTIDELTHYIEG
ncbi:MAG: CBS domain-containing protein [Planctomycetota bacterium]|nr:CBS domain-containing protein [Planctomycetota bacterium]